MKKLSIIILAVFLSSCMTTTRYEQLYPDGTGEQIEVTQRRIVWFYSSPGPDQRWKSLDDKAREVADGELASVEIDAGWSPLSLLLYFGMFGFVETATMTAEVTDDPHGGPTDREFQAVKDGSIYIGMPAEYAEISIGKPMSINRTVTESTVREQWIWDYGFFTRYVYVENGEVVGWQD